MILVFESAGSNIYVKYNDEEFSINLGDYSDNKFIDVNTMSVMLAEKNDTWADSGTSMLKNLIRRCKASPDNAEDIIISDLQDDGAVFVGRIKEEDFDR